MPLRIKCPSGHSLIVSESRAGQTFRCPKCRQDVQVPGGLPQTAPVVPVPPPIPPVVAKAAKEVKKLEPPPVVVPPRPAFVPLPSPEPVAPPVVVVSQPPAAKISPEVQSVLVATAISLEVPPASPPPQDFLPLEPPSPPPPPEPRPTPPVAPSPAAPRLPFPAPLPEQPPLVHSRDQVAVVFQLATAVIVAAVFSVVPSAWDLFDYVRGTSSSPLGRWAIVLGMLGAVQVAYAIYLIQLPDWTTVWMVTLFALASAALYAMALGLTIISGEDGWLVRFLQLSDKVAGGKAALWCLCMMSVMTLLAFFAGRISVRWRQAEAVLREAA